MPLSFRHNPPVSCVFFLIFSKKSFTFFSSDCIIKPIAWILWLTGGKNMKRSMRLLRYLALALFVLMLPLSALADTATVLASALYLREDPSSGAAPIGLYRYGTEVTVLNTSKYKNWAQVRTKDGKEGYMYKAYLSSVKASSTGSARTSSTKTTKYIYSDNGGSVNLRKKASTSSALVDRLLVGTKVTVLSEGATWSHVQYGSKTGYVRSAFLTSQRPASLPTGKSATVTAAAGSAVHLRQSASTKSKVVESIKVGSTVSILSWGSVWTHVRYGSRSGYIMTRYLQSK